MRTLDSIRTSLLGASVNDEARRAALDSLLLLLDQQRLLQNDPALLRTALKLLSDAAVLRPSFLLPHAALALRALLASGKRTAADALAVFASVAESAGPEGQSHAVSILGDEDLVLALASSRAVSVRARFAELLLLLLVNGQGGSLPVRPGLLLTLFLGLSNDIYPRVRSAALDGLAALCKNGSGETHNRMLKEDVYDRALPFLRDDEPEVKSAAIRLVSRWGQMLVENHIGGLDTMGISDAIFIQLCSVARDMAVTVRVEAFRALGNVKLVSEYLLLQSLSKKVLKIHDGESSPSEYTMHLIKESKCLVATAAGAFIHGLEDEYYEVREAACISMGKLTTFSAKFSDGALNLLTDILNDDKMIIKLRTLRVFLAMATYGHLKVQEIHMHMFLGMLVEASSAIRNAARKVLSTITLPALDIFKLSIESLLTNLEIYPEDEKDVFAVFFLVGRNHKKFAAAFVQAHMKEMDLKIEGDLLSDSPRTVALLILAISVTFSSENSTGLISREVFGHAILFLGRISSSLQGIVSREQILAYLSRQSGLPYTPLDSNSEGKDKLTDSAVKSFLSHSISCQLDGQDSHLGEGGLSTGFGISHCRNLPCQNVGVSVSVHEQMMESGEDVQAEKRQGEEDKTKIAIDSAGLIMKTVVELRNSIHPQHLPQIQQRLRSFHEELEWIAVDVDGSVEAYIIFVKEYVQVIGLTIEVWRHTIPSEVQMLGTDNLDIVLDRLDLVLRRLRYTFVGFNSEEEGHLLELILLGCVSRSYKMGHLPQPVLMRAQVVISQLEHLHDESPSKSSDFVEKVKSSSLEPRKIELHDPSFLSDLLRSFPIKQIDFTGKLRHIKAELYVPGNDSENPFPFIPGLPAGITLRVKLYNISESNRVWVQLSAGGMVQHVYLDLVQFGASDETRSLASSFPFYGAPKAPSFVLKVIVLMECPFELDSREDDSKKGPKCKTVPLCDAKYVYMVNAKNR